MSESVPPRPPIQPDASERASRGASPPSEPSEPTDKVPMLPFDVMDDDGDWPEEPTQVMPAFAPGTFFADRFRIERVLGMGGMSRVYEATDLRIERRVALKVLYPRRRADDEVVARFRREAELLARLDHPGVVRVRDFGQASDGTTWLSMDLLEGETLSERLRREKRMGPGSLVPIVAAVADALEAAHAAGIVHRDIKPDNVFLPSSGSPPAMVLDFGLSTASGVARLTRTGAVLGTPRYMAPEQLRSASEAGPRADVYALGVLLYEALSGQSPFEAADRGELLGAILEGRRVPLRSRRPDLPAEIEQVLERAMHRDPAARFEGPRALAEAFAEALGRASYLPTVAPASGSGAGTASAPTWLLLVGGLLLGILLGALGMWLLARP